MVKISALFLALFFLISINSSCLEVKIISPVGAVARSAIPGWGQLYTHHKIKAVLIFLSVASLGSLGIRQDGKYRQSYREYRDAVFSDSPNISHYFSIANDHYKLSRFLLYTAGGIWVYGAIDAYIDAHIYNAKQKRSVLSIDNQKLQQFKSKTDDSIR